MKKIARVKDTEPVGGDMEIKALSYRLVCHLLRNYRTEGLSGEKALAEKTRQAAWGRSSSISLTTVTSALPRRRSLRFSISTSIIFAVFLKVRWVSPRCNT